MQKRSKDRAGDSLRHAKRRPKQAAGLARRAFQWALRWALRGALFVVGLTVLITLPLRWIDPPTSSIMLQRHVAALSAGTPGPGFVWVDRSQIAPSLAVAVIAAEDQKFPDHLGFDFDSIAAALDERGMRTRGASTISQQVAKNLYLWPGRSLLRKGVEAYLTVALELFWTKTRVLEIYLNLAEFGPNTFGAEAASRLHFDKSASDLTEQESALFAAVLPNPSRLSAGHPSEYVLTRAETIRREARRMGGTKLLQRLD